MTRGDWYAQHNGGGWRKARTDKACGRALGAGLKCRASIVAGSQYFDTMAPDNHSIRSHVTIKICAACATEELK